MCAAARVRRAVGRADSDDGGRQSAGRIPGYSGSARANTQWCQASVMSLPDAEFEAMQYSGTSQRMAFSFEVEIGQHWSGCGTYPAASLCLLLGMQKSVRRQKLCKREQEGERENGYSRTA